MPVSADNRRAIIAGVIPEVDAGRFPIKRTVGEKVVVEADVFTDGHEAVSCEVIYRKKHSKEWVAVPMVPLVNDRWRAEFTVPDMTRYCYTIRAWLDHFKFWSRALVKRVEAGQDVTVELQIGANIVETAIPNATDLDGDKLKAYADVLRNGGYSGVQQALSPQLAELMYLYAPREPLTVYERELEIVVDPVRARFSAWYEFFPRSSWGNETEHGTLRDCIQRLEYVSSLGFDVVYLPPIHPIGHTHRKGKNNSTVARPDDEGSPWAIGSEEGGHKAIHPALGTIEDFRALVAAAKERGMDIAMDIAFQCSPDHPYVKEHPEWFRARPDGTIQYAENPPKKYEDIYPFDFDTEHWRELWDELKSVFYYWMEQGARIFRVDNPHTKAFHFWEWLIDQAKHDYPDSIFLAEAFTRPKVMYYLAKSGFTQSYNYFPWRNTKWELTEYLTELTQSEVREYFRANLWPNTPDILTEHLQVGGRPAFISRLVLAATLGSSYGIYGPAYELCENRPIAYGKEEYLDSEKYEIKHWDIGRPDSLAPLMARINSARHDNPALQHMDGLRFHNISNDRLIAYTKATDDLTNVMLMVVSLDPVYTQSGIIELPLDELGIDTQQPYQVHDLLSDTRYLWSGRTNYVELNPRVMPAHLFRLRRKIRTEQDFDYYM